ncbi:ABC transporter substrate-binding protein [Achromobacter insolitus]|uniref:Bug family tripartite tricarboxylate transporter substrate binding protein n=1 Tax=Achromobacter insolitus TaxID=217204 RepID=UPI0007C7DF8A|nr:tripartite tricarboxylate transporter substrate binding protein [Achromobacter insolitus]OAE72667.1 ABC transporter substrate-binding protein [Achromobacter insolitus]OCZ57367.1 ABC transporter substrate-binding protein [Achromobacter insolitus]
MFRYAVKLAGMLAAACIPLSAQAAQAFPDKPVRLIVAYTPGGATDVIARILAAQLTASWGQQVIVENRSGASGMIGAEQVARAKPDGYTLLLAYTPEVSINKLVYKQMRYDPLKDLQPIALVADAPLVLVSGPKVPATTYADLKRQGAQAPLVYGSPGTGGQQHLAGELLRVRSGMNLTHVPYRGTALAVADLVGGQIDIFFATAPAIIGQIGAGKLHPLFIAGPRRQDVLPATPTAKEVGLDDFDISNWFGLFGPAGMPAALVDRISKDTAQALQSTDVKEKLQGQGLAISYKPPQEFKAYIGAEMAKYGAIIKATGLEPQ